MNNELNFFVKIRRNFKMVPGDYVILQQVMKRGFTIGKFITSQRTQAGLTKVNHQLL